MPKIVSKRQKQFRMPKITQDAKKKTVKMPQNRLKIQRERRLEILENSSKNAGDPSQNARKSFLNATKSFENDGESLRNNRKSTRNTRKSTKHSRHSCPNSRNS